MDMQVRYDINEEKINSVRTFWSWMDFFVILVGVLLAFTIARNSFFLCVQVRGESMYPTLSSSDYLLVNRESSVKRGDVVVIYSSFHRALLIKRVVALPGDTVCTRNGFLYLKKAGDDDFYQVDESYLVQTDSGRGITWYTGVDGKVTDVPETYIEDGKVYVLGDNRRNSSDSRKYYVGALNISDIAGVVSQFVIDNRYNLQFLYRLL